MPAPRRPQRSDDRSGARLRRPSLADVRIRTKLGLILIIPVLAILTLTALRLGEANGQARDAEQVGDLTDLSGRASALAHELHRERMTAAAMLVNPTLSADAYNAQLARTTTAAAAFTAARDRLDSVPSAVADRLRRIGVQSATLASIRNTVTARQVPLAEAVLRYGLIITELVSYREAVSQVTSDARLADSLIAAAAFSKAKLLVGEQEAVVFQALRSEQLDEQQYSAFIATLTGQQEALVTFSLSASASQRVHVERTIAGNAVQLADNVTSSIRRALGASSGVTADQASAALGAVNDLMRTAELRLDTDLLGLTRTITTDVQRQLLIEAAVIIAVLAILIALAFTTARSMAHTLRRLRDGALVVADHQLAEAVHNLRDTRALEQGTPEEIAARVPDPIDIRSRDEIGEVAQAFHVVFKEAVRIAAEQAALRASVSAMFLNLARRSQTLVDRMIGQLDRIERGEEDPQRLAQLFQLDHLATRMRRNDENVLVLAGADTSPPRLEDAPLADVMRAAQSEVEQYERIEFGAVDDDLSVAAHAVNDVVRLLAELFDNAARFSPPDTAVVVEGRRIGDIGYVRIEDRGLGMTPEEAQAHNARFAAPPSIDITTFRMMGLAVVSRLAYRHGIQVYVQGNPAGGTVVELKLPDSVLILPAKRHVAFTPAPSLLDDGWRHGGIPDLPPPGTRPGLPLPTRQSLPPAANGGRALTSNPSTSWPVFAGNRPGETTQQLPVAAAPAPAPEPAAPAPSAPAVDPDDTAELPIFREIEATWFRNHGHSATGGWPTVDRDRGVATGVAPVAGAPQTRLAPPPRPAAPARQAPPAEWPPAAEKNGATPEQPPMVDPDELWRTRADAGWRAAAAAANPPVKDRTRSGLPKRQPRAQLVPGGVADRSSARRTRDPEETRGRLAAYHRGVRRGRALAASGGTDTPGGGMFNPTNEENDR